MKALNQEEPLLAPVASALTRYGPAAKLRHGRERVASASKIQRADEDVRAPSGADEGVRAPSGADKDVRAPSGADKDVRAPSGADEGVRAPSGADEDVRAPSGADEDVRAPREIQMRLADIAIPFFALVWLIRKFENEPRRAHCQAGSGIKFVTQRYAKSPAKVREEIRMRIFA